MEIELPSPAALKQALCNKGYRSYVDVTDIANKLGGKKLSIDTIKKVIGEANNDFLAHQKVVSEEELQKHTPKIMATIVQRSPHALKYLQAQNFFTPEILQELKQRGIPIKC